MAGRIVLFGATGYTGALTAEEIAIRGIPAVLAGRDRPRLQDLGARLGGGLEIAAADVAPRAPGAAAPPPRLQDLGARLGGGLEIAAADVAEPATVAALLGRGDVLITTVGPFARWGHAAVNAAVERGASYLDSTGEPS